MLDNMLIHRDEWPDNISHFINEYADENQHVVEISAFGDLIVKSNDSVKIFRMTWITIEDIATVIDEIHWSLEDPINRGCDWIYPNLLKTLPTRKHGHCYHFITPLGLNGPLTTDNIIQIELRKYYEGMIKLLKQVGIA